MLDASFERSRFTRRLERGLVAGAQTSLTTLELGLTINAFAQMQACVGIRLKSAARFTNISG